MPSRSGHCWAGEWVGIEVSPCQCPGFGSCTLLLRSWTWPPSPGICPLPRTPKPFHRVQSHIRTLNSPPSPCLYPNPKHNPNPILSLTQNMPYRTNLPPSPSPAHSLARASTIPPQPLSTTGHQGLNSQHLWPQGENKAITQTPNLPNLGLSAAVKGTVPYPLPQGAHAPPALWSPGARAPHPRGRRGDVAAPSLASWSLPPRSLAQAPREGGQSLLGGPGRCWSCQVARTSSPTRLSPAKASGSPVRR